MEGIIGIRPAIKRISFKHKGKIDFSLADGRQILVPLSYFPSIKKLSLLERKKWYIIDEQMFSFDASNEIFHIEQFLGKEKKYLYSFLGKPILKKS